MEVESSEQIFREQWETFSSLQWRGELAGWAAQTARVGTSYDGRAPGSRRVVEGMDGLLHSLGLKKRTWKILKKLLHIKWFSASHCIALSFTEAKNWMDSCWAETQLEAGNEMDCESNGLSPSHAAAQKRKGRWVGESEDLLEWLLVTIEPLVCQ